MSAIDVASPLRRAAERRAATQPYPRRRPRRSQRLGNPNDGDVNENEHDDEERDGDALLDGAREETAAAARGGLFSRLFSFFPLGGSKKPVEPTKQVDALDASMASTSDHDDEKAELETSQESLEMVVEVAVKSPVKSPLAETAVSNGRTKPSRSPPSKRSSPARVRAAEKKQMSPLPVSSVFGHSSDKTKTLQIGSADAEKEPFAFQRVTGRRRNKPSSPRVTESPLAVIKKKKPISFEEYERLSTQLRNLVEATPENALALTRSTLSNALEPRGSGDAPASEVAGRDRRELSVAALPSVKRARPSEDLPITLPREDRLTRKPKPSRLLTGTKRDVASRSAYSAAVAEKILSTLNKIQTPLDKESQKPTPSTSLSWAKYQLALTKQESSTHGEDESMDADDQVAPPTVSVPKVAWKPAVVEVPPKTASVVSKTPTFSFPKPAANVEEPPAADVSASATASSTSNASVATAQTTIKSQYGSVSATGPTPHRQMGQFAFTLPQPASPSSKTTIDESVQYVFTPPPALREPPKRSPGQTALTAKSASTTTPFSFMPSSPRVRPESLTKSVPRKEKSPEKVAAPVSSASAAAPSSATNPLARFMQVDAGSWRCSTCAVMNAANLSKCPCCETAKPLSESSSAGSAISVAPASMSSTPAGANPLARFMQMEPGSWKCPSCAVTNGAKYAKCPCCDTNKPGSAPTGNVKPSEPSSSAPVSTASSGFTFGVSTVEPKKTEVVAPSTSGFKFGVESPKNASTSSSGFSFGVSAQSSSAPVPSSAPAPVSSGFTFGVAAPPKTASDSLKPTGGFTFGTTSTSASASADSKSISTKRKSSDEEVREGSSKKPAMPSSTVSPTQKTAEGFTFNVAASSAFGASASGFGTGDADKSKPTGGFTFGSTTTATGSVSKTPFTFGSSDGASATKVPEPSFVSSDQKTDVTPFKFGASDEKTATPSFTFGSSSAKPTEEKPGGPKPSFTFGATSAPSTETKPTDSKPSFTFGTPAVSEPKPASSSPPKVSFGFPPAEATGPTDKNAPFTFGAAATANSQSTSTVVTKPAFEFGSSTPSVSFGASASTMSSSAATTTSPAFAFGAASSDSIAKKVEAPAFTFGGSSTSGGAASAFSGDKPPTSAFGQAPAFGSTAPSSSGFGASSRSFSPIPSTTGFGAMTSTGFGSTTTPAASSSFGSAVSSGFGSSTSSGFGTSSGTFGSTSASTSFGSTPTTTPSFSTTPSSTPGAPAFAFGASTPATSQSGFGFGASTTSSAFTTPTSSAFGASSQTSGFGSAPAGGAFGSTASASGFGMNSSQPFGSTPTPSPAFGAAGNGSGFGGTAFGASAPVGGAFGVPTPTPVPAFGGSSSTFGAPSASFGAPGNAFGATPSPAAAAFRSSTPSPVFGAPATPSFGAPPTPSFGAPSAGFGSAPAFGGQQQPPTDGFNMGSAPPKRRILKAKSRPKRA